MDIKNIPKDSELHCALQPLADIVYAKYPWLGKHPEDWSDLECLVRVACKRLLANAQ